MNIRRTFCVCSLMKSATSTGSHPITVPSSMLWSMSSSPNTPRATRFPMYLLPVVCHSSCSPAHQALRDDADIQTRQIRKTIIGFLHVNSSSTNSLRHAVVITVAFLLSLLCAVLLLLDIITGLCHHCVLLFALHGNGST